MRSSCPDDKETRDRYHVANDEKQEVDVDTDISEVLDENAMRKLLYPEGYLLFSSFSLSVNRDALEGWVKQFSGCCCACAIAGSVNAVFGLGRPDEEEAKKSRHVLKKRPPLSRFDGLILLQDQIRVKVKRMVRRYVKKFELRSEEIIIYEEDEKTPWIDPDTFNVFTPLLRELYEEAKLLELSKMESYDCKTKKHAKPTTVMWLRAIREIVNDDKETILNSFLREKLRDLDRETPPPGTESSDARMSAWRLRLLHWLYITTIPSVDSVDRKRRRDSKRMVARSCIDLKICSRIV